MAVAHRGAAQGEGTGGVSVGTANADVNEIGKFDRLAARWWDPQGESRPLHELNPARLRFIADRCAVRGTRMLDLGCGGGILSESLAAEGAEVVGLDLAEELIEVARLHALESGARVDYRHGSAESLAQAEPASFDAVCCMEMLEHVPDPAAMVGQVACLTKPGGDIFLSTLNRTPAAFAAAIVGAEYVLRLLPRGTHQYERFIRPSELSAWLRAAGCSVCEVRGLQYVPPLGRAFLGGSTSVNYLLWARRDS